MKNCVSIQLRTEDILIHIKGDAQEEEIKEGLRHKMEELKRLYQGEKTPIYVVGKVLKNREMEEITKIIKEAVDVEVEFETSKTLGLCGIKKTFYQEITASETKFHKGSLRSGQKIEFEGSLVILGDVNAGAEVIAGENIAILGALRGLAHAGAKGNKKAIIASTRIDCPQIRIANIIKELEKEKEKEKEEESIKKFAYINENNEIILEE